MAKPISRPKSNRKSLEGDELHIAQHPPQNLKMGKICVEEWAKIPVKVCVNLINYYRKHLTSLIANKGFCAKY